ncbi:DUF2829 domain-containing protein [Candidatus Woesebacteria bacterium]|nr:DUF2829 domain-containing protein [Candidatus Woesebacteria bacterium]
MPSPTANQRQFMDFYEALAQLPLGWKITRAEWGNESIYGFLDMSFVKLHKEDGSVHNWIISEGDMAATDWYMVVETMIDEEVIN